MLEGVLVASEEAGEPHGHHRSVWKCRSPGPPLHQPCEVELCAHVQGTVVFVFFRDCPHTTFWPSLVLSEGVHMEMEMGSPLHTGSEGLCGEGNPQGSGKCGLP